MAFWAAFGELAGKAFKSHRQALKDVKEYDRRTMEGNQSLAEVEREAEGLERQLRDERAQRAMPRQSLPINARASRYRKYLRPR